MTGTRPTYVDLLDANRLIQACADETYWLCVTRTVQGSKLFPVSPYMMLSYLNAFYRYPELLRKIETRMKAEDIADRARNMGVKLQASALAWGLPNFYLLGREWLISMGMLRPQDAIDDVLTVMDFWRRFMLSWHRNDGHLDNSSFGHRAQILPDRRLEVFKADMHACEPGDPLHEAAQAFLATVSQYGFLVSCESRISLTNHGPYRLDAQREMIVRDFMDLGETSLPWLDGVAEDVPFNNLTVPMAARDCHFNLVDDWGSFESEPEFTADRLCGVGLYASDALSDGFIPIGMESKDALAETFRRYNAIFKEATNRLWLRMAAWTRDEFIDAGALVYFNICKELAHVAGVFAVEDWLEIDPRADRFRPILNDEFAASVLGELVGGVSLPNQQASPFTLAMHSNAAKRLYTPLPYSVLAGEDFAPSAGPIQKGKSRFVKNDRYRTTAGVLSLAEYNKRAREFTPTACSDRYRFLCETWVKYNHASPLAQELYGIERRGSRMLDRKADL